MALPLDWQTWGATAVVAAPIIVAVRGWAVHKHKRKEGPTKSPITSPRIAETPAPAPAPLASTSVELEAPEGEYRIALHGDVYDITRFHERHPGGKIILAYAGKDASDVFELFHPPHVAKMLSKMRLGKLASHADAPPSALTLDYRQLRRELWAEGHFEPDARFYALQELLTFGLVLLSVALLLAWPSSRLVQLLLAPGLLGLGLKQAAFLSHDTMHNGVLAKRGKTKWRTLLGEFNAGVLFGISMGMWLDEHSGHHAYTLRPHADPQFTYFPLWLQSAKEIKPWRDHLASLPKLQRVPMLELTQFLVRIQHFTWLPLSIVIGRVNLCLISLGYAVTHGLWLDVLAIGLHAAWYTTYVRCLLPDEALTRFLFVLVHFSWTGVLHVQLLLSHLMMQQFDEREEQAIGFAKCQLLTTRNIKSSRMMRWFHGGLDMQIEHHLFPQLPRHQLHAVAPRVRALASRHGLPYTYLGFFEAIGVCLGDLHRMSSALVMESMA